MRQFVGFLFLSLVGLLVALPGPVDAGNCGSYTSSYYGRSAYYQPTYYSAGYYPATYYQPTYYSAPVYQAPCDHNTITVPAATVCDTYGNCAKMPANYASQYTPNPYNIDTIFKVAPELAYGRINDEVATKAAKSAVDQFKAEIQAQEATRQREADRARQERLLTNMETALSQQSAVLQQLLTGTPQPPTRQTYQQQPAPAYDYDKERMAEEIRQLRAILEQQRQQPQQPQPQPPAAQPVGPPQPQPQPIPPAKQPAPKGSDPISVIQTAINSSCLDCHGGSRAGRMNLTNVASLNRGQLSEMQRRMVTPNKKKVMPPPDSGHPSPDIAVYNALDELIDRTPFATSVGN